MKSKPGKEATARYILPNLLRSKDNQTIKFGQLIVYNTGNIFLVKSYTKCGEETIHRLFSKKITRKTIGFKSLRLNCLDITKVI